MLRSAILYSLFLTFLLTSCSPSQKEDTPKDEEYDEYEIADPAQSALGKDSKVHIIEIKQMKFEPEVLNVKKGDKVIWMNKDFVEHDITEFNSKAWASSKLPAGASYDMVVTKSEVYYCNLHVVMRGKLVVDGGTISLLDDSGITMCKTEKTLQ